MSSGVVERGAESPPPVPAVCRWTIGLFGGAFLLLSLVGCVLETLGGQTGFMARPSTLLAFGVSVLGMGVSGLLWSRTLADAGWQRRPGDTARRLARAACCWRS